MHSDSLAPWQKSHAFLAERHDSNARRTKVVLLLTLVMMAGEIAAGTIFSSMALLADGWHMASHAVALGLATFAYDYARRHADNPAYTFGTGKVGDLAAFASALVLFLIAGMMAFESISRLVAPVPVAFGDAMLVAVIGLIVNLVSAWMLMGGDEHAHHHDHNMRAAYVHVLADALTSVLAIAALAAGLLWDLVWLDAAVGIVGAIIITRWSCSLLRKTARILLDAVPEGNTEAAIRTALEAEPDNRIADLHVWRVGPGHLAAMVTVVTHSARTPAHYKKLLAGIACLNHVTVEVEHCCDEARQPQDRDEGGKSLGS